MKKTIYLLTLLMLNLTCSSSKNIKEEIIWVSSSKQPCEGVIKTNCLRIKRGSALNKKANWELFYDSIYGFTYQPRVLYQLKVRVKEHKKHQVPADGSSKSYYLQEVLSKTLEDTSLLENSWELTYIQDKKIRTDGEQHNPRIYFNLKTNRFHGRGACNRFSGKIEKVTNHRFELNQNIVRTEMYCPDIQLEDAFFKILPDTRYYEIAGTTLVFKNKDGEQLVQFTMINQNYE
ncbi:hypothetical protein TPENAI_20169 [Tenacibaculum litopenaei]|uniref:DUF4377 domain-containing protein n=1 Tax=Tenacibaculum litopenaei TaxID=396016 RepID=UPI003895EB02